MPLRSSTTAFAKSTRPEIGGVVRREALFARLDGASGRTIVWIAAPPGFGKTTLAATYLEARSYRWAWYEADDDDDDAENFFHYLAHAVRKLRGESSELPPFSQEHRADLAAFARRFFRALFAHAAEPIALVFDNLHELPAESDLRVILEAGLPQVPRQCCVIVTSRAAPPVALARLQPSGQMIHVHADELKMTPAELAELARLRGQTLAEPVLQELHRRADGWAAALVLMVEQSKFAVPQTSLHAEGTPRAVFDYLAGEIFERFEPAMQRLLLQIACLPRVTIDTARALSGDDAAARVLLNLAHNDYFVRELVGPDGRVFVFHPLLREFLLQRAARDLPEAVGSEALRRAARLLRDSGQMEDALALFVQCKEWREAGAIAASQADELLRQGRHATLSTWLEWLPPELVAADGALLLAQGGALAHVSPRAARRKCEDAFDAFRRLDDRRGMLRACIGVIDAILREFDDLSALDRWLGEFDRLELATRVAAAPPSIIAARLWRNPTHPSVGRADVGVDHDLGEGRALVDAAAALLSGEFARSAAIAGRIDVAGGIGRITLVAAQALRLVLDGDSAEALAVARGGLALSAAEGLHVHDTWLRMLCAAAALGLDDLDAVRVELDLVDAVAQRRGDRAFAHYLRSWLARATDRPGEALREAKNASLLAIEAGLPWLEALARIAAAQLLAAAGERAGAEAQMRSADAVVLGLANPLLRLAAEFTRAAVALAFEDESALCAALPAALALSREIGVHHVPGVPAVLLASLCAEALRRGIAADHTRLLIEAGRLVPPESALRLRRWPWSFEITTLGRFTLNRGSEPIEFSAKGPGRPVELLKVLISLGGVDVRVDTLADALWPHVDADYAHKSFTATLHRLRRMLGEDDAIRLRDGRLSLNPALFWLDNRALDQLLAEIEERGRDRNAALAGDAWRSLVDEALALYKGPFLLDDIEQPAYTARREQLRARLLRTLTRLARLWEDSGHGEIAVDCYLRCIDADEQCEAFYRNLMLCYQRHGNAAEALATYARLQAVLAARLKTVPSAETEAIRATLRL
jgi:LuxR family maltose regulon positive regulatory protein